jgi:protein-L-isoaspartate(D-aspartate) O-methyltransferase
MKKTPERLRAELVAQLQAKGVLRSSSVAGAFASVPREQFIPEVMGERGVDAVYGDQAFITKTDPRGMPLSSSSQPALMAKMLELLDVRLAQRVLEIGAGTGYNAALLANLVGPQGKVTSVEVDEEIARRAKRGLKQSGYSVAVKVGDGRSGWPDSAPYDRIIVTACADEIPRSWLEQLEEGGLLELPVRLDPGRAAIQLIPVFQRRGDRLHATALTWGGFMPLHGGDGGWNRPVATLSAGLSGGEEPASLLSISGPALAKLSASAAKALLAAMLSGASRPRATGYIEMSSANPPLLLIYLLLGIPSRRRLLLHGDGALGIGLIHGPTPSAAFVSVRSPWEGGSVWQRTRVRWRLDAYGGDAAEVELKGLLADWEALRRAARNTLRITASGSGDTLRLRFAWVSP